MFAVLLVDLGSILVALGLLSLIKPLAFLKIRSRGSGGLVGAAGVLLTAIGFALPAQETRVVGAHTQLDQFAPVYQFHEFHSIKINASKDRVYRTIKTVSADDISLFRTLTWIRRLGRSGSDNILNPPSRVPILEVATRTTFLLLAEEPQHEIVFGTAVLVPPGWRPAKRPTPDDFKALHSPGFVVATMNFLVEETGSESCVVTTETRVYATDPASRRKFARYWRVIYPGSALIRRMWLRAIRQQAEMSALKGSPSDVPSSPGI